VGFPPCGVIDALVLPDPHRNTTDVMECGKSFPSFVCKNTAILGLEYENWMLVIGLPIVIFFVYVLQRG
jgi:hypothetical protein